MMRRYAVGRMLKALQGINKVKRGRGIQIARPQEDIESRLHMTLDWLEANLTHRMRQPKKKARTFGVFVHEMIGFARRREIQSMGKFCLIIIVSRQCFRHCTSVHKVLPSRSVVKGETVHLL